MSKKGNPTVDELFHKDEFVMIARLSHAEIRDFVIRQLMEGGKLVKSYMIYQLIMVTAGIFFIARAIIFAVQGNSVPMIYSFLTLVFVFSGLILIHELIHGFALKITGVRKIRYGGYLSKFIFYAEADRFVMNRIQYTWVALAPFVVVKIISMGGILFFVNQPEVYVFWLIMCSHSLFCAGDLGMISYFWKFGNSDMYTFDIGETKTSYFFIRTTGNAEMRNVVQP